MLSFYQQRKQYKINVFYIYVLETWKGGWPWVDIIKQQGVWAQCTQCGDIVFLDISVPIDTLYITTTCKRCENNKALNCGSNQEDIYIYYDPSLDKRYYRY